MLDAVKLCWPVRISCYTLNTRQAVYKYFLRDYCWLAVQCLVKTDLKQTLLQLLVFPLTVVHVNGGSLRQLASDLLTQLTAKLSNDETDKLPSSTRPVPTSTSEFYSELCATAELYCQLSTYVCLCVHVCVYVYYIRLEHVFTNVY